ncbi:hypothetical protein B566_EDAN014703 [Ephemera danica]|nr:hypothetical protein B566_EDAN014703 [Ephemera danica]
MPFSVTTLTHILFLQSKNATSMGNREQQKMGVATVSTSSSRPQIKARDARIVCDTMVQGLGKKLRHLGVDTHILESGLDHTHCARVAHQENRFIVTRGSAYTQVPEGHICQIKSDQVDDQIKEVFTYFNIVVSPDDFFSRCHACNSDDFIEMSNQQLMRGAHTNSGVPVQSFNIPSLILNKHQSFDVCNTCGKCYWEGSHKKRFCEGRFAKAATSTH